MTSPFYMNLPHDSAGSMSKNRFRNELLWGLWKAFEIYSLVDDFTIIFDYVCDIEIHIKNEFDFYQLKTRSKSSPYTIKQITSKGKKKNSILGKLYLLKLEETPEHPIKVTMVSNVNFKSKYKEYSDTPQFEFPSLDEEAKKEIEDKIINELPKVNEIDFNGIYYIRSHMDLTNPKDAIIGKIASFFVSVKNCEIKKPHALYCSLLDTVEERACYEFKLNTYEELVEKKGITRQTLDDVISVHIESSTDYVNKINDWIKQQYSNNFKEKLKMISATSSIFSSLNKDLELQKKKQEINQYLIKNMENMPNLEIEIIDYLAEIFKDNFVFGYDKYCLRVLILLVLVEMEERAGE